MYNVLYYDGADNYFLIACNYEILLLTCMTNSCNGVQSVSRVKQKNLSEIDFLYINVVEKKLLPLTDGGETDSHYHEISAGPNLVNYVVNKGCVSL